jgi:hypothetical protein
VSISPADTPREPSTEGASAIDPALPPALPVRQSRMWAICFALLAFEIGGFLMVFPWMEAWHLNHFPSFYPPLFDVWDDPYFRGSISGLGVVDVIIAIWQTARLIKISKKTSSN